MQTKIYTLPELTFVGGQTQEMQFNLKKTDGSFYNARHCTTNFSVCNYSNKTGTPLFSLQPTLIMDGNQDPHTLRIIIPANKTVGLYGKYIYQLTIRDTTGKVEIPNQGIMYITKNINQGFITL